MKNNKIIKIAFLGTPNIGTSALKSFLNNKRFQVVVVVTVEDKPIGRSHSQFMPSAVAKLSQINNLDIIKTNSINKDIDKLKKYDFDYLITCAFGQFLSDEVLALAKIKSLNIHASLLPEGRGGAPIHWAIINDKKETGISFMEMVAKMDAGDFYIQDRINISENDTYDSLYEKLSKVIYELSAKNLIKINDEEIVPISQDETQVTYWLNIKNEDRIIDWNDKSENIIKKIRGLFSKPCAVTNVNNLNIKLLDASLVKSDINLKSKNGEIINITKEGIFVKTKDGIIVLKKIIIPGKKATYIKEIINGSIPFEIGDFFLKK